MQNAVCKAWRNDCFSPKTKRTKQIFVYSRSWWCRYHLFFNFYYYLKFVDTILVWASPWFCYHNLSKYLLPILVGKFINSHDLQNVLNFVLPHVMIHMHTPYTWLFENICDLLSEINAIQAHKVWHCRSIQGSSKVCSAKVSHWRIAKAYPWCYFP